MTQAEILEAERAAQAEILEAERAAHAETKRLLRHLLFALRKPQTAEDGDALLRDTSDLNVAWEAAEQRVKE